MRDETEKEPAIGQAFLPFFRIYANQKPRKNFIGYVHSSGKPWCGARVQKHRHAPVGTPPTKPVSEDKIGISRNTLHSHESVSTRHTFLKFLFHCFAVLSTLTNEQLALLVVIVYAAPIAGKPLPASHTTVYYEKGWEILQRKPRKATVSVLFVLLFLQVKTRFMYWKNFLKFSRNHSIFGGIWREKIRQGHLFTCLPTVFPRFNFRFYC